MFPGSFWDKFDPEDARVMTDEAVFSPDEFPNLPFCQPDKKYLLKLSMSVLFRHTETGVTRYVFLMLSPVIKYTLNNDGSRNYIDYK